MESNLSPFFEEILDQLITLLEENLQAGKYIDSETGVTQEVREGVLAVELIKAFGPDAKSAVPVLIKLLDKDTHFWFPSVVADTLRDIGIAAEAAIPRLASLMLDEEDAPRSDYGHYNAASALGRIGSEKAIPFLIKAAQDPNSQGPGWSAIKALALFGSKATEALPVLIQLRQDPNFSDYWADLDYAIVKISIPNT